MPNNTATKLVEASAMLLVDQAEQYVHELFQHQDANQYLFHNIKFIEDLVAAADEILANEKVSEALKPKIMLAAWFAFSGYAQGHPAVAENSKAIAKKFFNSTPEAQNFSDDVIALMQSLHYTAPPKTIAQAVLRDAASLYLAKKKFLKKSKLLKQELESFSGEHFSATEWSNYLAGLYSSVKFHTDYVKSEYQERFQDNLDECSERFAQNQDASDAIKISRNLERGVDSFFRIQSRNMFNLVALADRKAQMIIGVNSISMSILFATFEEMISSHSAYMIAVGAFMATNIFSMICAVLVISPNIPKKQVVKQDDVLLRHGSLMTQVMFSEIEYDTFRIGMKQMMADESYLYDTLIKNLYDTGRVLVKKFRYLKFAYQFFIYGLSFSTLSFIVLFLVKHFK